MFLKEIEIFFDTTLKTKASFEADVLKTVLELILKIDNSQIDNSQSEFSERNGEYELRIYSKSRENCNLFISFLHENIVDIQLNKGGEYLHLQRHESKHDLDKLDSAMRDILFYPIAETLTFCEEKLIKAVYRVNHNFNGEISQNDYVMSFGSCWPWKSKRVEQNDYLPWINKEKLLSSFR